MNESLFLAPSSPNGPEPMGRGMERGRLGACCQTRSDSCMRFAGAWSMLILDHAFLVSAREKITCSGDRIKLSKHAPPARLQLDDDDAFYVSRARPIEGGGGGMKGHDGCVAVRDGIGEQGPVQPIYNGNSSIWLGKSKLGERERAVTYRKVGVGRWHFLWLMKMKMKDER